MQTPSEYNRRVRDFFAFMTERHQIFLRSKVRRLPREEWTTDPILGKYRFCNVFRELDTVTVEFAKMIRDPFANHKNLWFMLALARQINLPATIAELIADKKGAWPTGQLRNWNPERARQIMNDRAARGEKVYTGAYMLTCVRGASDPVDKPWYTTHRVLASLVPLEKDVVQASYGSMQATHEELRRGVGWGGFLAYEVVCDMRWTRYGKSWNDVNRFAHAGPGALRGLSRLNNLPLETRWPEKDALRLMVSLLEASTHYWSKKFPALELREIEHSLCEFDKYERVRLGQGAPRSLYKPAEQRN